jgi:hypothetical protein
MILSLISVIVIIFRNEEYTIYATQSDLEKIFCDDISLQSSQMKSPYMIQELVGCMTIEKMVRSVALEEMLQIEQQDASNVNTIVKPDGKKIARQLRADGQEIIRNMSLEEANDIVKVLTIRSRNENSK